MAPQGIAWRVDVTVGFVVQTWCFVDLLDALRKMLANKDADDVTLRKFNGRGDAVKVIVYPNA